MNTLQFFLEVAVMSPHDGGTHLELRNGGSGDEGSLPNYFGWEFILFIKTHFYGGALTLHFMEEHSSPTSIFPVFMMTSSNGNMFRITGFWWGIHRWLRGIQRSSVNSSHTDQWRGALMFSLNKRLSKKSRRRWFETPSRSWWRHCSVVPNSDPVIRAAVRSFGVERVTLVQFWIGEMG